MEYAAPLAAMPASDVPAALRASGPIPNPLDWARDKIVDGFESLLRRIVEDFTQEFAAPVARFGELAVRDSEAS